MAEIIAAILTEISMETAKELLKQAKRGKFSFLIPNYYDYPITSGPFHENPVAVREGFIFHVVNGLKSPVMLSFLEFVAFWKEGSKEFLTRLEPPFLCEKIKAIGNNIPVKVILPWKQVVLTCLYAEHLKEIRNADFFHLRLHAYDDYTRSSYYSEKLNAFFIRTRGLMNIPELGDTITEEELRKVGWRKEKTLWIDTAMSEGEK